MTTATGMLSGESATAGATLRRGIALSPELAAGFWVTLALAAVATVGRVLVPIAVQQAVDKGFNGPHGPDARLVAVLVVLTAIGIIVTGTASALMTARLFRSAETG